MASFGADVLRRFVERNDMNEMPVIPFPRDPNFVGRKSILKSVRDIFERSRSHTRAALVGLGGVGKSQIAIEYAYDTLEKNPKVSVFWVHASSAERFRQSYKAIADRMSIVGRESESVNILNLVSKWLKDVQNGPWLLVLDGADEIDMFRPSHTSDARIHQGTELGSSLLNYLPQSAHGSILITSRDRNTAYRVVGDTQRMLPVEPMDSEDAKALLRAKLPNDQSSDEEFLALIEEMNNIPLAITQASAYIATKAPRMTISKYLDRFHEAGSSQVSLLSKDGGDLRRDPDVPNSVIITWQFSFEQIKKQDPNAAEILSLISLFDGQAVPGFLLCIERQRSRIFEEAIETLEAFSRSFW